MKSATNVITFLLVFTICLGFTGCKRNAQPPLVLVKYGPDTVKAGEVFNKQPDGSSAIWSESQNATKSTVLVINETKLLTTVTGTTVVTAIVLKSLYDKQGTYSIYLVDTQTGLKSNEMKFIVQ